MSHRSKGFPDDLSGKNQGSRVTQRPVDDNEKSLAEIAEFIMDVQSVGDMPTHEVGTNFICFGVPQGNRLDVLREGPLVSCHSCQRP